MAKRDLSNSARHAFSKAYALAERFEHSSLDTDHLLFGLLAGESTIASKTLKGLGVRKRDLIQAVERKESFGLRKPVEKIELSLDVKAVMIQAALNLKQEGRDLVEPWDLLFGMMKVGQCAALDLLNLNGITDLDVLAELTSLRNRNRRST